MNSYMMDESESTIILKIRLTSKSPTISPKMRAFFRSVMNHMLNHPVDGRNPAPPDMYEPP